MRSQAAPNQSIPSIRMMHRPSDALSTKPPEEEGGRDCLQLVCSRPGTAGGRGASKKASDEVSEVNQV